MWQRLFDQNQNLSPVFLRFPAGGTRFLAKALRYDAFEPECLLVALPTSGDLLIFAKDLLVEAMAP